MARRSVLPKIPSALIRLALSDLQQAEVTHGIKIDMSSWYRVSREDRNVCTVCLAGAVMAVSCAEKMKRAPLKDELGAGPYFSPYHNAVFSKPDAQALIAIDDFRRGKIWQAMDEMGLPMPDNMERVRMIPKYERDRLGFKSAMHQLANDLEAAGL